MTPKHAIQCATASSTLRRIPFSAFVRERWMRTITQVLALRLEMETVFSFLPDVIAPPPRARDLALSVLVMLAAYLSPIRYHWGQPHIAVKLAQPILDALLECTNARPGRVT